MWPRRSRTHVTSWVLAAVILAGICIVLWRRTSVHMPLVNQPSRRNIEVPLLNNDNIYADESESQRLFGEVRILCTILTTKSAISTRVAAVNYTWGPRCNKHIYIASVAGTETSPLGDSLVPEGSKEYDLSAGKKEEHITASGVTFSTITIGDIVFIDSPEGYGNLTEKSREIVHFIYLTELDNYDWFLKADHDTYVIVENLRFLLSNLDSSKPSYLGYHLEPHFFDMPYMSGGAGYVFSKEGLRLLVEKGLNVKGVCLESDSSEDLEIGRCAGSAGVTIYGSRDRFGRETFHPEAIQTFIPGPPLEWLYIYSRYKPKSGADCCSQFMVSFHRMQAQEMLMIDHLLYRTSIYGRYTPRHITNFFRHDAVRPLSRGIPTVAFNNN